MSFTPHFVDITLSAGILAAQVDQLSIVAQLNRFFTINCNLTLVDATLINNSLAQTNTGDYRVRLTLLNQGARLYAREFVSDGVTTVEAALATYFNANTDLFPLKVLLGTRFSNTDTVPTKRLLVIYAEKENYLTATRKQIVVPAFSDEEDVPIFDQLTAEVDVPYNSVALRGNNLGNVVWPLGGPNLFTKSPLTNTWAGVAPCGYAGAEPSEIAELPECCSVDDCCGVFASQLLDVESGTVVECDLCQELPQNEP